MRGGGSIPLEKGGRGGRGHPDPNPDPKIKGDDLIKTFFRPFGPQFGLNVRGALP